MDFGNCMIQKPKNLDELINGKETIEISESN